ncbi:MAG: hypothetical protein IPN76_34875 [Saprospiraceae bacterium]|nr:hypothetical protein [Saprospiraceae bacterium]
MFFDEGVVNATIFLIMATCFVSSFVTDRVARRMATASIHPFSGSEKTQRILVPISNPASVVNLVDFAFLIKTPGLKEPVFPLSIILDEKDVRSKIEEEANSSSPRELPARCRPPNFPFTHPSGGRKRRQRHTTGSR